MAAYRRKADLADSAMAAEWALPFARGMGGYGMGIFFHSFRRHLSAPCNSPPKSHAAAVVDFSCLEAACRWSSTPVASIHNLIASPRLAAARSAFAPSRNSSNAAGSMSLTQQPRIIVALGNFRLRRRTE